MTITNLIKVILSIDVNSLNRYEQIKGLYIIFFFLI